jgi:predicted permease
MSLRERTGRRHNRRAGRRLGGLSGLSLLDFKLGVRMLVKHPGLTVVGGLAMAFAIWIGALTFEVANQIVRPVLPLPEGHRIVGIQNLDAEGNRPVAPFLADFLTWREEVESIQELSAFRTVSRNLITGSAGEGASQPVHVAQISPSSFPLTRVPPLLGRTLAEADKERGAPLVLVLGYDLWQSRFLGDPEVVGRTVRLGSSPATVVGVMPEGFGFPVAHSLWIPLRESSTGLLPGEGGKVAVFGRLAPGVTVESAQAELDALAHRRATAHPAILRHIRPQVLPFARSVMPLPDIGVGGLLAMNVFVVMLLAVVCGNVALLIFARAATRMQELGVRSALGAGRGRIVTQLFAEALVLGAAAALLGLACAGLGMRAFVSMRVADFGAVPFWIRTHLAPSTVLYLCALTLLGAAVAGVGPALKVTRSDVALRLRQATAGMAGLQLTGVWSLVIAAQVAVTVAFPATAFFFQRHVANVQSLDMGFPAEEYLSVRLETNETTRSGAVMGEPEAGPAPGTGPSQSPSRLAEAYRKLKDRLSAEPDVLGVTAASRLPGELHPWPRVEIEGMGTAGAPGPEGEGTTDAEAGSTSKVFRTAAAWVEPDFLEVLRAPVLAGRDFPVWEAGGPEGGGAGRRREDPRRAVSGTQRPDSLRFVLVNQAFTDQLLKGRNPIGRRVRYTVPAREEPGPWYEIVGLTRNLGMIAGDLIDPSGTPGIYHPFEPGTEAAHPLHMAVHVRGDPEAVTSRLRNVAADVDPRLRLHEPRRLDRVAHHIWAESLFLSQLLGGVSLVALILSLGAIYSVVSFAVSHRTREIGVRVALGGGRPGIAMLILRRPLTQIATGIAAGGVLMAFVARGLTGPLNGREMAVVAMYAVFMLGVCLLASVMPLRRALGIEPTEALRAEG